MKMTDMGTMPKHTSDCEAKPCDIPDKPNYPRLDINTDQLPALEGYDVGDVVMLQIKAKVVGKNTDSYWSDNDATRIELKLLSGGCADASEDAESEEDEPEDEVESMKKVKSKKLPWDAESQEEPEDE